VTFMSVSIDYYRIYSIACTRLLEKVKSAVWQLHVYTICGIVPFYSRGSPALRSSFVCIARPRPALWYLASAQSSAE
jgi:hypothetical protein